MASRRRIKDVCLSVAPLEHAAGLFHHVHRGFLLHAQRGPSSQLSEEQLPVLRRKKTGS